MKSFQLSVTETRSSTVSRKEVGVGSKELGTVFPLYLLLWSLRYPFSFYKAIIGPFLFAPVIILVQLSMLSLFLCHSDNIIDLCQSV